LPIIALPFTGNGPILIKKICLKMSQPQTHASKEQVEQFYDTYKEQQKRIGVNIRHRTILKNLLALGLRQNSKVLEVGCGIGTVSGLIIGQIPKGSFVGVDISQESVQMARSLYASSANAEFLVSDMSDFTHSLKFDFIVLPDVLEHIPVELHSNLFRVLSSVSTGNAVILINIPEPNCLDWIRENHPEKLQIIDQSLSMQDLLNNSYPHGWKLFSMQPYALQYTQPDYVSMVLKKNMRVKQYERKSKLQLAWENLKSKL
jgi:trans-aconitate 2-methyltransferase